jgi:hypothetical protein
VFPFTLLFVRRTKWTDLELPIEGFQAHAFPLVAPRGNELAFNFVPGMEGEMVAGGRSIPLSALAAAGQTSICPIPADAKIRVRAGQTALLVSSVPRPRRETTALAPVWHPKSLVYAAGSLAAHLAVVLVLMQVEEEQSAIAVSLGSEENVGVRALTSQVDQVPPEQLESPEAGDQTSGGSGTRMALAEGTMGNETSRRLEGQYRIKNRQLDPQLARERALDEARTAGLLGSTALRDGGAFASLTGTGNLSSGFDEADLYGGLVGSEAGEMHGGFGYGRAMFGPGGGGPGWGTVGVGRWGTIGHGDGTGPGYGIGPGRGPGMSRRPLVPQPVIGEAVTHGDLDRAIIRRYIKRNLAKIQYCYEKQLLARPGLAGTVATAFFISGTGSVASSTASGVDAEVSSCVAAVIKAIEFPKPSGGGTVQVSYPFTFRSTNS